MPDVPRVSLKISANVVFCNVRGVVDVSTLGLMTLYDPEIQAR
jgi:hypothetical protein